MWRRRGVLSTARLQVQIDTQETNSDLAETVVYPERRVSLMSVRPPRCPSCHPQHKPTSLRQAMEHITAAPSEHRRPHSIDCSIASTWCDSSSHTPSSPRLCTSLASPRWYAPTLTSSTTPPTLSAYRLKRRRRFRLPCARRRGASASPCPRCSGRRGAPCIVYLPRYIRLLLRLTLRAYVVLHIAIALDAEGHTTC